jgi:hypothetical protein
VRNVNITNARIRDVHNVNWNAPDPNNDNYSLRRFPHAVTVVPQQAFAGGRQVMRVAEPLRDNTGNLPAATNAAPTVAPIRPVVANNAHRNQRRRSPRGESRPANPYASGSSGGARHSGDACPGPPGSTGCWQSRVTEHAGGSSTTDTSRRCGSSSTDASYRCRSSGSCDPGKAR